MKKLYSKIYLRLLLFTITSVPFLVNAQRYVQINFTKDTRIIAGGSSAGIYTSAANSIDGTNVLVDQNYSGGSASSGSKLPTGGTYIPNGIPFSIPALSTSTYNAKKVNVGATAAATTITLDGNRYSGLYILSISSLSGGTYTNPQITYNGSIGSSSSRYGLYDWVNVAYNTIYSAVDRMASTQAAGSSNDGKSNHVMYQFYDFYMDGNGNYGKVNSLTINPVPTGGGTDNGDPLYPVTSGSWFIIGITGIPVSNISGAVYADNTNDGTPNGVGTNAAAGFISAVDPDNNKILGTASVASNGTYTMYNVLYPTNASTSKYNLILTTNAQTVGGTLSSSTLNTGWADGFTPGTNLMGTQNKAIISLPRSTYSDLTGQNISVHQLPTADTKIVNFTSSSPIPSTNSQYKMSVVTGVTNGYNVATNGLMPDLSGTTGQNSTASLSTANGSTSNSMGFYIPSAITDGGSLIYNGSTVTVGTVYPASSGVFTGYNSNVLYYKFPSSGNKNFSFTYNAIDQFGFISTNTATYSIKLNYVLPVKYSKELVATANNNTVDLSWTTGSEINNSAFDIQRSIDAQSWSSIGSVKSYYANGTGTGHSYSFTDEHPLYGLNYYRLKQVDLDGASDLSRIVQAYSTNANTTTLISPNPVVDFLNVKNLPSTAGTVTVFSMNGSLLKSQSVSGTSLSIDLSSLASGVYLVNILDKNGAKISMSKIIKK